MNPLRASRRVLAFSTLTISSCAALIASLLGVAIAVSLLETSAGWLSAVTPLVYLVVAVAVPTLFVRHGRRTAKTPIAIARRTVLASLVLNAVLGPLLLAHLVM